ncbi:hypothetical protein [Cystobacter ferrugineus]|uniref:Lipoprotein n=1 Tax=Cystobacter ferrugineus TaxID=83449 RepID=A0A1L9BIF3_9BACT|nr:hypothetical protein [Cystobacter ferrugineus]OJH42033.1 hypothetical protein BON30_02075 [Cystobacter ferrugineus]
MNVKTLAALVGTLSLGSLAAGCATTHRSAEPGTEKGTQGAGSTRGGEASCGEGTCSGKATQKGGEASCGEGTCGGDQKAAAPEKGSHASCGESGCGGGR